jgi:putative glycosyltransferase (TIGR04348 family)
MVPCVIIVSPALPNQAALAGGLTNGNAQTATRWAVLMRSNAKVQAALGLPDDYESADMLVALHARRSAASIAAWHARFAQKPLVVVLTGTDLYKDLPDNAEAQQSLQMATHLVVLQEAALDALPVQHRHKARVIHQSGTVLEHPKRPDATFTAAMIGHLRDEKDPLTLMRAAARLNDADGIHIRHAGDALDKQLGQAACNCEATNAHYRYLGALPYEAAQREIAQADVLVHTSKMEGGAHVLLEACLLGTPVLASRVSGNLGMLGADYDGYFDVGDDAALVALLRKIKADVSYLHHLRRQCLARAPLFDPKVEQMALAQLLQDCLKTY